MAVLGGRRKRLKGRLVLLPPLPPLPPEPMSSLPVTRLPVAPVATPAAMLFPKVLNHNKDVRVPPTAPPKKTPQQEALEQAARAAQQEERHRLALMRSFAGVRTEFLDLDGQTSSRTIRVHRTSPGPSTPTRPHPFLQSHHAPETQSLRAVDPHADYVFDFDFSDILRPPSPPPSPTVLYNEPEQIYVHGSDSDTDSDTETIRPTSRRQSLWDSASIGVSDTNQAGSDEDTMQTSRPASRLGFWDDSNELPRILTVRNGDIYTDGASLFRTHARSCKSY